VDAVFFAVGVACAACGLALPLVNRIERRPWKRMRANEVLVGGVGLLVSGSATARFYGGHPAEWVLFITVAGIAMVWWALSHSMRRKAEIARRLQARRHGWPFKRSDEPPEARK
jgi:hypothetical protein